MSIIFNLYRNTLNNNRLDGAYPNGDGPSPLPAAPSGFTAVYLSDTSLTLSWTDNADNELNFEIDRSPNGTNTWTPLADPAANATSATSTGLTVDTTYYYRLRAVNASGNSDYVTANGTTTAAGGGFVAARLVDFNGLSHGQSITRDTSGYNASKSFEYWATYANGYGSRAVTDFAYNGATSCAELSIESGSDGGAGGGTGPNGGFGGGFASTINASHPVVAKGEEMWWGMMIYVPTGFKFTTNTTVGLKGCRFGHPSSYGVGKVEHHFNYDGTTGANSGINILTELQGSSDPYQVHTQDRVLIPGQWNWIEFYLKPSDIYTDCVRRVWINDQMVIERVGGTATKWHDGTWQTQTHDINEKLLVDAAASLTGQMLFTYWNGGAPQTQKLWIQRIVMHKTLADLSTTDEFGNKLIGSVSGMVVT